ncbi:MAG: DUF3291 domain-containing protein [Phenylobacterium sp.]|uniref:DUF3291 domain-containing protein n=1 Tax=Phenylobacterium sp. TaxID=1871053 RepID=UPI0025F85906|nr:DUF3291 domain-containing protein [Phenylobacterium sp.]MBA4011995.1 DUF3291 domain-containing protein [Phenylobacterium sp.]
MSGYHLAQINVARLKAPIDAPETADFKNNLDRINALAESSPGFVWRLTGDGNDATDLVAFDDPLIITNLSVWESPAALGAFVYRSGHVEIMRRRAEWFHEIEAYMALWWVPVGHAPTLAEAVARLELLRANGPGPDAFTFRAPHPAPDATTSPLPILDKCA